MTENGYILLAAGGIASTLIAAGGILIALKGIRSRLRELERRSGDPSSLAARQDMLINTVDSSMKGLRADISAMSMQNDQKLDFMRRNMESAVFQMQRQNAAQLDDIRRTVDEKLETTLEKNLNRSFEQVSLRLEQVYKGLGEMQALASGVGDLKKVLSNVKTRGILGEIQLGAILDQILSPEQYSTNVAVKKGSQANVEFAVKLPGSDGGSVWLPIDSKFPLDCYSDLLSAYDTGDQANVEAASKELRERIRRFAKDIHTKYISPPETTDFAIMFLPSEGLYAEAVRIGMVESLQQEFKVCIAGPTTMGALLNSLQMGFRTLALQRRSGEVWNILNAVKREFDSFGSVLESTQKRILQANDELDRLVGVRTRKIQNTLRSVQSFPEEEAGLHSAEEENDA